MPTKKKSSRRRRKHFESLEDRRLMTTVTFRDGGGADIADITFDDTSAETWGSHCLVDYSGGGTLDGSCGNPIGLNSPNYLYANRVGLVGVKDLFAESWAAGSPDISSAYIELVGPNWDQLTNVSYVLRSVETADAWLTEPRGQNEVGTFPSSIGEADYGTDSVSGTWATQGAVNRIEITDLVEEMMAQGDDFALAITVPTGTLRMLDSENTNLDFRPKIEITYDEGSEPPQDTVPPTTSISSTPTQALVGTNVTLNVAAEDNVSDVFTYAWTQSGGPFVTLTDTDTASPSFEVPTNADWIGQPLTFDVLVFDEAGNVTEGSVTMPIVAPSGGGTVTFREGGGGEFTDVTFDDTSTETWGSHCLVDYAGGGTPEGSCSVPSGANNPNYLYANRVGLIGVKDLFTESWADGSPVIASAHIELVGPNWDQLTNVNYELRSVETADAWLTEPRGQNEVGTFPSSIGEADYGEESVSGTWATQGATNRIEITDLVIEMMAQGDDFALAITVPTGTLRMLDSEHTNPEFRPKIEINYASSVNDTVTANDHTESMIGLGVETIDLASHVGASGPVTYEIISNSGNGEASLDGSQLSYSSTVGDTSVQIQYRATSGTASDVGSITLAITDPVTVEDLKQQMINEFADIPGMVSAPTHSSHFYNGAYVATAFREMITATHDIEMWNHFKTWVDNYRTMPKHTYNAQPGNSFFTTSLENMFESVSGSRTTTSIDLPGHHIGVWNTGDQITIADWVYDAGDSRNEWRSARRVVNNISFDGAKTTIEFDAVTIPAGSITAYATFPMFPSPWERFGASGSYERPKFVVNFKQESQWAHSVMWTLHRAIQGEFEFDQAEVDWAIDAWRYIHHNTLEFHYSAWAAQGAGFEGYYVDSAVSGVPNSTDSGYFGSSFITTLNAVMIDKAINEHLANTIGEPRDGALYSTGVRDGVVVNRWRPVEWAQKWMDKITIDNQGRAIWDTGNGLSMWGCGGNHDSPSVGHTSRHIQQIWMADELGHFDNTVLKEAFSQTFAQNIVLPVPYTYQSGDFAGQQSDKQNFANFIDGNNSSFRNCFLGYEAPNGSNESTNGFVYSGWYLAANKNDIAKQAIARLFHESKEYPTLKDRGGAWYRHNGTFGQFGLAAAMIAMEHARGEI